MAEPIISKRCSKCKQTKPLIEFYKNRTVKDGYRYDCKVCKAERQRQYRKTDKGKMVNREFALSYYGSEKGKIARESYLQSEEYKAKEKRYRQSEKGKATWKAYLEQYHKTEKYKAAQKRYNRSEKYRATQKRYRVAHPERVEARIAVKQAIKDGVLPKADSLKCHYCPTQAEQYHHYSYAPEHWLDVIPVCKKCHNDKTLIAV